MNRKTEAYIHVKARLWNATLVADYPRVDLVKIVSYAEIQIPAMYGIQQNKQDDTTSVSIYSCSFQ
jgi:integrin alpha 7